MAKKPKPQRARKPVFSPRQLRRLRASTSLGQHEFADLIGRSCAAISRMENGLMGVSQITLRSMLVVKEAAELGFFFEGYSSGLQMFKRMLDYIKIGD